MSNLEHVILSYLWDIRREMSGKSGHKGLLQMGVRG